MSDLKVWLNPLTFCTQHCLAYILPPLLHFFFLSLLKEDHILMVEYILFSNALKRSFFIEWQPNAQFFIYQDLNILFKWMNWSCLELKAFIIFFIFFFVLTTLELQISSRVTCAISVKFKNLWKRTGFFLCCFHGQLLNVHKM